MNKIQSKVNKLKEETEKEPFKDKPEADVVVNYVNTRFNKGLGTNIFIIGLPGSGKSSASQRIGELIIEKRKKKQNLFIVDSLIKFIEKVKDSKEGDIIVIEEVSVLFPSRRAMGRENLAVAKIFDTIRKKKVCLISNAPIWTSIDKHMRALGDILIQTIGVLKRKGVVISKFYRLQTNPSTGKTYIHTMTREGKDVALMYTRMPDAERWKEYEEQKDKFIDNLYQSLLFESKKKNKIKPHPKVKTLSKRELQVHELCNRKGFSVRETAERLGVSQTRIYTILKLIKKKAGDN